MASGSGGGGGSATRVGEISIVLCYLCDYLPYRSVECVSPVVIRAALSLTPVAEWL